MASECGEFMARKVNKAATYKLVQQRSQLQLQGTPQDSHTYAFTLEQPTVVVVEGETEGVDDCVACETRNRQGSTSKHTRHKVNETGDVHVGVRVYA
jgi:hypothetical protein